jgi:hypothetical protein
MTHREFLLWLLPRFGGAGPMGLEPEAVHAIREELERMRKAGPLQPFASRLLTLVREQVTTLDAKTVAELAADVRCELAPPREQTVVLSAILGQHER